MAVDFAGPVYYSPKGKAKLALYACSLTSEVHLDPSQFASDSRVHSKLEALYSSRRKTRGNIFKASEK